ncbi:hypothetical protein BS78_03G326600 [Paspalum vaginatum]|nr:hypothetical protein BS78_03G326600 [Paspalum vaginatum]
MPICHATKTAHVSSSPRDRVRFGSVFVCSPPSLSRFTRARTRHGDWRRPPRSRRAPAPRIFRCLPPRCRFPSKAPPCASFQPLPPPRPPPRPGHGTARLGSLTRRGPPAPPPRHYACRHRNCRTVPRCSTHAGVNAAGSKTRVRAGPVRRAI